MAIKRSWDHVLILQHMFILCTAKAISCVLVRNDVLARTPPWTSEAPEPAANEEADRVPSL